MNEHLVEGHLEEKRGHLPIHVDSIGSFAELEAHHDVDTCSSYVQVMHSKAAQ
jgi:hypothetical protein